MASDHTVPPYRLSPAAWQHGYDDMELTLALHENDDGTPAQDQRRLKREINCDRLSKMDATELRAFIDGMQSRLAEDLW